MKPDRVRLTMAMKKRMFPNVGEVKLAINNIDAFKNDKGFGFHKHLNCAGYILYIAFGIVEIPICAVLGAFNGAVKATSDCVKYLKETSTYRYSDDAAFFFKIAKITEET